MTTMTDSRAVEGDVRGLVALAERVQYADTHALVSKDDAGEFVCLPPWLWLEIRDAAVEALAADGVQAGEVEQRSREADRQRFSDPEFNAWLDTGISDAGHTVWDAVGDTQAAWAGWEARQFAGDAVLISECCGREECGGECGNEWRGMTMCRKPAEALSQQPEARGVVDKPIDEAVVLARGWLHRRGPGDDYDLHDEASGAGKDCHGCIPCIIVRADAFAQQQGQAAPDLVEAEGEIYARREVEPEILHEFRPVTAPPPSAPVGVEAVLAKLREGLGADGTLYQQVEGMIRALAQQPAAVDESFVERFCGRWFQLTGRSLDRPSVRACLTEALATQHQEPTT